MGSIPMRVNPTLVFLLLLFLIPFIASDSDGRVELDMVCPTGPEGFTIISYDFDGTDLKGWSVSDGEGTISFNESVFIGPMESVTVMSQTPPDWMQLESYVLYGESGIVNDGFNLNDKGDEIYLKDPNGNIIESFCYGDSKDPDPFQKITKGHVAQKNHMYEYDDYEDRWILHVPGRTQYHLMRTYEDCEVIPFSFPESNGEEILAHIQDAKESIRISIYTFDNKDIASAIKFALDKGVKVRMLIEGGPAGGIDQDEIRVLTTLWKSGADIRLISSEDSYKRYQYIHSKYAIIDDDITIITSENWTDSAFSGNRGWGSVIRNEECASYLMKIFDSDFTDKGDLNDFRDVYPTSLPYALKQYVPVVQGFESYVADVSPVICPDYSFKTLKRFITSATERVYSQQLNVQFDWTGSVDNPLQWMRELGSKGIDSRLLVDVTYASPYDKEYKDGYGLYTMYQHDTDIKLRYFLSDISGLMHNKGIIVDDKVWIGSMNWTDNSIWSNREMSVIIHSKEISDMFTGLFLDDWGTEFDGTIDIKVNTSKVEYGEYVTLDASDSSVPFGSEFSWNLDNDEGIERTGHKVEWKFYEDTDCTLIVTDMEGNVYTKEFHISLKEEILSDDDPDNGFALKGPLKYIPLILLIAGIMVLRRFNANR